MGRQVTGARRFVPQPGESALALNSLDARLSVTVTRILHGILAARRSVVVALSDLRLRRHRRALAARKAVQRTVFAAMARDYAELYARIEALTQPEFVVPDWNRHLKSLERRFRSGPPFAFLREPEILYTMFMVSGGRLLRRQLAFLEDRYEPTNLSYLLEEDLVGMPVLMNRRYSTSHQAIHHLYHLTRFAEATSSPATKLSRTVEWGGGYGNLAKLYRRLHGRRPTQVIIDLPVFTALQYIYLGVIFGRSEVNVLDANSATVEVGKVNLVPVGLADSVDCNADLFVSTWAISESSSEAQEYVRSRDWFGAPHLLLAYQTSSPTFPSAGRIGELASAANARVEPVGVLPGSHYAFR